MSPALLRWVTFPSAGVSGVSSLIPPSCVSACHVAEFYHHVRPHFHLCLPPSEKQVSSLLASYAHCPSCCIVQGESADGGILAHGVQSRGYHFPGAVSHVSSSPLLLPLAAGRRPRFAAIPPAGESPTRFSSQAHMYPEKVGMYIVSISRMFRFSDTHSPCPERSNMARLEHAFPTVIRLLPQSSRQRLCTSSQNIYTLRLSY